MASIAGMLGLSIGLILLLYHLCKIEVFGVSYMVPYTSNEGKGLFKDTFIRAPINKEKKNND
jgi:spore germination protein KA